jgi:HlyD family secretion protein
MRRWKLIFFAVFLPLALIGGCAATVVLKLRQFTAPPRTAKVEQGDVVVTVRETGTIEPIKRVEVKSKVAGLVAVLAVEEGDRVEAGQLIARLNVPEVEAQRDQIKAQADAARARLHQARLSLNRDREVVASEIIQSEANVRAAQSAYQEAETRRRDAERIYTNKQGLLQMGGYVPQNDVDAAKAALDLAAQQVLSAQEQVKEQQAALSTVRARGAEVPLSESRVAESEASLRQIQDSLAEIESKLRDAVISAPCSGVVIARNVRQGELITAVSYYGAGAPIVTIGDLSTMLVKANLNEVDIDKVRVGQSVKITTDALPNRTQQGKITRISPASVSDPSSQGIVRFPVEITVTKGQGNLRTGMTANVEIACRRANKVLWVPNDTLFQKGSKWYVTVVKGKAKKGPQQTKDRQVTIGLANDARTEIRSGLKAGELVQLGKSGMPERKKIDIRRESERRQEG